MDRRAKEKKLYRSYPTNAREWWLGRHLWISSHAINRAQQYEIAYKDLPAKKLGGLIAKAIYFPVGELKIVEPRVDITYQVAIPLTDQAESYALISPDDNCINLVICRTVLDRQAWQLYGYLRPPTPNWYHNFRRQIR